MADSTLIPRPGDTTNKLLWKINKLLYNAGNGGAEAAATEATLATRASEATLVNVEHYAKVAAGDYGLDVIADTNAHNGTWLCFHALADCVIDSLTAPNSTGSLAGVTVKAGDRVFGYITSLTLTSGTGILYRAA